MISESAFVALSDSCGCHYFRTITWELKQKINTAPIKYNPNEKKGNWNWIISYRSSFTLRIEQTDKELKQKELNWKDFKKTNTKRKTNKKNKTKQKSKRNRKPNRNGEKYCRSLPNQSKISARLATLPLSSRLPACQLNGAGCLFRWQPIKQSGPVESDQLVPFT